MVILFLKLNEKFVNIRYLNMLMIVVVYKLKKKYVFMFFVVMIYMIFKKSIFIKINVFFLLWLYNRFKLFFFYYVYI